MSSSINSKKSVFGYSRTSLETFFKSHDQKPFRASQLLKWVHQRSIIDFNLMTDMSKELRSFLSEHFCNKPLDVIKEQRSADGTRKWLFKTFSGSAIEAVYIPEDDRATLCVSSQAGCELNCKFCHTGTQGFERQLTCEEIVGQLWYVNNQIKQENALLPEDLHSLEVTNVVFMGMGEPLRNLDAVIPAIEIMLDDDAYGLSKRRVTVSTSGVVPGLKVLSDAVDVALALSLHATDNQIRSEIIPLNKKYPLEVLLPAVAEYLDSSNRKMHVTIEYVMLKSVNDHEKHAYKLAKIVEQYFQGRAKVNLIPFNPFPTAPYESTSTEDIKKFAEILRSKNIIATIRKTRGQDISGACGQLAGDVLDKTRRRQIYLQKISSANHTQEASDRVAS